VISALTKWSVIQSIPPRLTIRWIGLTGLLAMELVGLTMYFDRPLLPEIVRGWREVLEHYLMALLTMGLTGAAAFLVIVAAHPQSKRQWWLLHACAHRWWPWLAWHVGIFWVFVRCTAIICDPDFAAMYPTAAWTVHGWLIGWLGLGAATLLLWLCTIAPVRVWRPLVQREYRSMLAASLVGVGVWGSSQFTQELWHPLATATLWIVYALLRLLYTDVIYERAGYTIGTPAFEVEIAPSCSGYEGIGLITLFLALYLWLFRKHLRFPQALWLFPAGILTIWVANAGRLAALIAVGTSVSPDIAVGGFHSQAGWLAFLLVALGLITVAHRVHLFTLARRPLLSTGTTTLATALLMPLLVMLGTMIVTAAVSHGFDWLYPLRAIAMGVALWSFRRVYRQFTWTWSWQAIAIGGAVFMVWMLLEPPGDSSKTAVAHGIASLSGGMAALWVGFRVLGSVLMVPLAEELAFRGYVMRKLVARDFENVPLGHFTWPAFLLSSVLFGVFHGRWVAGSLAGMGYALALTRHGQLADAVLAHMTTNALIAAYVLSHHAWALWS
jgi:exosortase E/protease (VPEID-CTERM system)